jgi:cell wall-associated NlpC family hydrolase
VICFYSGGYGSIGHVGIYIGDGQFIHASSSQGKVTIDSLSTNYYNSHYYGARRIA